MCCGDVPCQPSASVWVQLLLFCRVWRLALSDGRSDDHDHRHIDDGDVHDHQCDHNPNDQLDQHIDIDIDVDQHVYSNCLLYTSDAADE